MPEMRFRVRLPDGREERCYSPSLIVRELLQEGVDYPLFEFMARVRAALSIASERVRLKYGYTCSAAMDQLSHLEDLASRYDTTAPVRVLSLYDTEG
jgi:uncharacterized repeat protein (TIGR04042 family)